MFKHSDPNAGFPSLVLSCYGSPERENALIKLGAAMKKLLMLFSVLLLVSCGTARGVLDGGGSVLEGVATDLRSLGSMLD